MFKLKTLYSISGILLIALLFTGLSERKTVTKANKIIWSENNITWDNFTKVEKKEEDYVASISYGIYCPENISWLDSNIYAYMDPDESEKLADSMLDDQVLIHEQYHFNITEYHTRLLRKEIVKLGKDKINNKTINSLYNKYYSENELMQVEYDSITDHNAITEKQRYWEMKIDDLLRQTAYYKNPDILSYLQYDEGDSKYFRKIYRTFDNDILCSFPIYEESIKYGESYKIVEKGNEVIVSFFKNGVLKNGGVFNTAIVSIKKNKELIEIKYFNPDNTLNDGLLYCIYKRYNKADKKVGHYYNSKKERVSVNKIYQTENKIESQGCYITSYYDIDLKRINNKYGIHYKKSTLDSLGRTIKIDFFDSNNTPKNDNDFVSKVIKEYDSNHQLISYKEYDEDGDFAKHLSSYNNKYEYDERGNLKRNINLNQDSEIAPNKDGISIYSYTYDLYDNCTSSKRFNKSNDPVLGLDDYHMVIEKFDEKGRSLFYGKYYPGYVLSFNDEKWGASKYNYPNDSLVYVHNLDVYNDIFNDDSGVAILKKHLDKKNRVKKLIYLDTNNNYAQTKDDIVEFQYQYDSRGNKIQESTLDSLGNIKAFQADVAIVKWDYDINNNKIKTTYYNSSSELASADQNVTYNIYKYNNKNQLIERTNFNKNMEPEMLDGYFKRKLIPSVSGNDSIVLNYNTNNKLLKGACKTVYTYNKYNNKTSKSFFNSSNKPALNDFGVSSIRYYYNSKQEYIGYAYFDKNGKKTNNIKGISSNSQTLNELGYVVYDTYFNKNDKPVIGPEGYHKKEYTWNEKGEVIKIRTFGANNKLIEDESGVAQYIYTIQNSGLIKSVKRYDRNGQLTNNNDGIAETYYTSYLNGLYYLEKELDYLGNEISKD
ncbi:hypothetical protein [Flavivirga spongiicola]|uniref:DUF922 domain-containing protein n=1 Tax=Flavivirga spongiicola TaxID=421621 RepID=A0ABU7XUI5_9FLAO|nr:hypothetical protein [Flavivirga sp. MEBiC05379]MDO5978584.1 hypothetical protein [Flavivirga sp. MEBiC05379]